MKKKQLIYRPDKKIFEIDGKIYRPIREKCKKIDGQTHVDYIVYEEINETEHEKDVCHSCHMKRHTKPVEGLKTTIIDGGLK